MRPFLTKREYQQLQRAQALLQRYHDRRCAAEQIDADHEPYDDDPAWHAKVAETRIDELLEEDYRAKQRAEAQAESEAFQRALDSGAIFGEAAITRRQS